MPIDEPSRPVSLVVRSLLLVPLCLVVLSAAPLLAQGTGIKDFVLGHDRYSVRHWNTDNGLLSNMVTDLAQTPDGYLWIATTGGLIRFDGTRLVEIDLTTPDGDHPAYAWHLEVDSHDTLWAILIRRDAPRGRVLARRTNDAWEVVHRFEGTAPTAMEAAPNGDLWMVMGNEADGRVVRWRDGERTDFDLPDVNDRAIEATASGAVWVGTTSAAAVRIENDQMTRFGLPDDAEAVARIYQDTEGRIWLGTPRGLYRRDRGTFQLHATVGEGRVHDIIGADTAHLWVAWRDRSLERIPIPKVRANTGTDAAAAAPFALGNVRTSLEDAEGNHWFGLLSGGLVQVRRNVLPHPARDPVDPLNVMLVSSVTPSTADSMWIVEGCRPRVVRSDGTRFTLTDGFPVLDVARVSPVGPDCVSGLVADRTGALWYLHGQNGVKRVVDGEVTDFSYPKIEPDYQLGSWPPPKGRPHHLIAGAAGELWYVREGEGIVRLSPAGGGEQTLYPFPDALADAEVTALRPGWAAAGTGAGAGAGEVWFGTTTGFGRLSLSEEGRTTLDDWPSRSPVSDIHVDRDGIIWVSTLGDGLLVVDGDSVARIGRTDGLPDEYILRILETDDGDLWLPSRKGVMIGARAALRDYSLGLRNRLDIGLLGRGDGAPEFRHPLASAAKGPDGRIWLFGRGVVVVDPAELRWNDAPPSVIIEVIRADGEALPSQIDLVVEAGTRNLDFRYMAATFEHSDLVRFRYRLDGHDDDWVDAGGRRLASYTNLWPGEYTFRVAARKNFGAWTEEPSAVQVRVLPLWWQTTWFMAAAVLGIIGLGAGIQSLRNQATRRRNVALEREVATRKAAEVELKELSRRLVTAQEEDRARVARDLHDDISQRLHAAAINVDPAIRVIDADPDDAKTQLRAVQQQLADVAEDTRKISHELHPATLEILGLASAIEGLVEDFEAATGVATRVSAPESVQEIVSAQAGLSLYRITQEALRNIAKHAGAREVEVGLSTGPEGVRLRIHDDGSGFDPDAGVVGLGLASMRERARLLDGTLAVDSAPNTGTTIMVLLPAQSVSS